MKKTLLILSITLAVMLVTGAPSVSGYEPSYCSAKYTELFPHAMCGAFYKCANEVLVPMVCPRGTVWNQGNERVLSSYQVAP